MTVKFASDPSAVGFTAPARFEADIFDCEVIGDIPSDLDGAFYRAAPDWFYPALHDDDAGLFNADGYISMFRFREGNVDYRGRYVKTDRYLANRKARRQLFGKYRNALTDDPAAHGLDRTTANTSIYHHGGMLWALKEDALPTIIDPITLETKGQWDFHGKYTSRTFTAHPKTDPHTGEMICYGYEARGEISDDVFVYFVDRNGHVTREVRFKAPLISMMHDIAITEKHIVFNTCGYVTNQQRIDAGKVHWGWDSSAPTYVAILPRDGEAKDVRWFKGPERGAIHLLNAVTVGEKVIVDAPVSNGNPFPHFHAVDGNPWDPHAARTVLRRWTFDLNSKNDGWTEDTLFPDFPGLLPRIDERFWSLRHRYGFQGYADPSRPLHAAAAGMRGRITNCYARFDFDTGEARSYFAGEACALQEVQFIPRRADSPEGEGYLIGVASNYAEMRSELVVLDAQRPDEGDIARVVLPFRLAPQVHGWWVPGHELPPADA
ncbi:MAG TPA: carotenoid oxygenase family protein [Ensifer sp.]|nr:carotenoid oxygenase family protein [Ensifer sp.]